MKRRGASRWLMGLVLLFLAKSSFAGTACCRITAINARTGEITALVKASGVQFQFRAPNAGVLRTLRVGQPVYANLRAKAVSLDGRRACCSIVSIHAAAAVAPTKRPTVAPNLATTAAKPAAAAQRPVAVHPPGATATAATAAAVRPAAAPNTSTTSGRSPGVAASAEVKALLVGALPKVGVNGGKAPQGPVGGQEVSATVELTAPAPCTWGCGQYVNGMRAGGMPVSISSSNTAVVQPPHTVVVPVGKTAQTFAFTTAAVTAPTRVAVSAARTGSAAAARATLTVLPPSLVSLRLDATNVIGGNVVHGTVAFNGPPASAGALVATLSSNSPSLVQIPASVTVDMNKTVATFDIHTAGVGADTQVAVLAAEGNRTSMTTLTLKPAVLSDFVRVYPCRCGDLTATINGAAPTGGLVIAISSNNPNAAAVPSSITIPAGANSATVNVTKHETYAAQNATISATLNGVTKKWDEYVFAMIKPDLVIKGVALQDRYGNPITQPQDSQPFKACATIAAYGYASFGDFQYPGASKMHIAYLSPIVGGTSVGHDFDIDVPSFKGYPVYVSQDSKYLYLPPVCVELPGLQANSYLDLKLTADSTKVVDETNEGNNSYRTRIKRP